MPSRIPQFFFVNHSKQLQLQETFSIWRESFFNTNDILLQAIGFICIDSAPAMLENRSGFATRIKNETSEVAATHCILHQQVLVSKICLLL